MIARRASGLMLAFILLAACAGGSTAAPASAPAGATNPTVASAQPASPAAGGGGANGGPVAAGADLCGLLGPGDFAAAGVAGAGKPTENNQDNSNVYCLYAGKSAGTGGIESDAFLAGSKADSEASYTSVSAPMLDLTGEGKAAVPGSRWGRSAERHPRSLRRHRHLEGQARVRHRDPSTPPPRSSSSRWPSSSSSAPRHSSSPHSPLALTHRSVRAAYPDLKHSGLRSLP